MAKQAHNVVGTLLQGCCTDPMTGFYRNGRCETGPSDRGLHIVCAEMTAEFLEFSALQGNDLSTPSPETEFPGLRPGDRWCLCAARWLEAYESKMAPRVVLQGTHRRALEIVSLEVLRQFAVDLN